MAILAGHTTDPVPWPRMDTKRPPSARLTPGTRRAVFKTLVSLDTSRERAERRSYWFLGVIQPKLQSEIMPRLVIPFVGS